MSLTIKTKSIFQFQVFTTIRHYNFIRIYLSPADNLSSALN